MKKIITSCIKRLSSAARLPGVVLIIGSLFLSAPSKVCAQQSATIKLYFSGAAVCNLCGRVQYACSNGSGSWVGGIKTFNDPLPSGSTVNNIIITVYYDGNGGGSGTYDFLFNNVLVSSQAQRGITTCGSPCAVDYFYPSAAGYIFSGTNTIQVIANSATMCVSRYEVLILYDDHTSAPANNQTLNIDNSYLNVPSGGYVVTNGKIVMSNGGGIDNGGTIKLKSDWTNLGNGLVNSSQGLVDFNGTTDQIIGGAITNFYNLSVSNSAGISLSTDATIGNSLTFNNGKLTTGINKVSLTANPPSPIVGAGVSSYVDGNLEVVYPNNSNVTYTYEIGGGVYAPATLALNGITTGGGIVGSTAQGPSPAESNYFAGVDPNNRVNQNWIFTNNNTSFTDYGLTLDFTNATHAGNTANYIMSKFDPSAWVVTNGSPSGTTIQATSLTSFSEFVVGEPGCQSPTLSVSVTDASCSTGSDGIIALSTTGGVAPFTYLWSNNKTTQNATGLSAGTYSVTVTGNNGCTALMNNISVGSTSNPCNAVLNLTLLIESYYAGGGSMRPVLRNEGVSGNALNTDTITVELHDALNPNTVFETGKAVVLTNGQASVYFSTAIVGNSYYIGVKHRNGVETWSAAAVAFATTTTNYDFTTNATQAYGSNQVKVSNSPVYWAFYSGDINQDSNVSLLDFPSLDFGINSGLYGYYNTDLNGDGNVDLLDFPVLDTNIGLGTFSNHP